MGLACETTGGHLKYDWVNFAELQNPDLQNFINIWRSARRMSIAKARPRPRKHRAATRRPRRKTRAKCKAPRRPARQNWLGRLLGTKPEPLQVLGQHRFSYDEELPSYERLQNRIDASKFRQQKREGTGGPIFQTVLDTMGQAHPRMQMSTSFETPGYWQ